MKLKELLQGLEIRSATADMETEIPAVSYDSRQTREGDLFVAMTGFAVDGHTFIPKAEAAGAAAVLCEKLPESGIPYVQVADTRLAHHVTHGKNVIDHSRILPKHPFFTGAASLYTVFAPIARKGRLFPGEKAAKILYVSTELSPMNSLTKELRGT